MINEITVTRAPRLKGVTWSIVPDYSFAADLSDGKVYSKIGTGLAVLAGKQAIGSNCHQMPSAVRWHPFEDFDAMCRWVVNGRKLEDIQGDCKDEWVHAREMAVGSLAVVMTRNYEADDVVGKVVVRVDSGLVQALDDPKCRWPSVDKITAPFSVWPLGPGDSITITPRNP